MPGQNIIRDAVTTARSVLADGRERIGEIHARGLDSPQVCGRLTSLVDDVVLRLFNSVLLQMGDDADVVRDNAALVALGSYGRRQLAPYSDVDLMVVQGRVDGDRMEVFAKRFLEAMYDVGLQLAQSVRTPSEIIQLSRTDPIICTSLIDGRLIVGKQPLFEAYRTRFARMASRRAKPLAREFHEARAKERTQYGESVYLLEPNVKRSRGALRDVHLLRWLGFVEQGESDPDRLRLVGAMSKFEHHRLTSAQAWLLRLRNEMHFHAGKANELLSRAEQLRIAEVFGHTHRSGLLPVEHLMRDYFRHTGFVWQMVRRREASLSAEPSALTRVFDPVLRKNVEGDYQVGVRSVSATTAGQEKLRTDLTEVLRFVHMACCEGKPIDQATWSMLLLAAPDCSDELSPRAIGQFREILSNSDAVAESLRILHELGYLERVVPAMRHARCLLQFNQYHKYTVDEHSLRAVRRAAEFRRREGSLGDAYRQIERKDLLHLALLLHDLGKGFAEDHSEVGLRIAAETAARLALNEEETSCVCYLVHRHLALSHLTFRRDTSDAQVMQEFVDDVGTTERLRMLFVVTCADLAAVGPGVLSEWKADVLRQLYLRAQSLMTEPHPEHTPSVSEKARLDVLSCLEASERDESWYRRQLAALPDCLLSTQSPETIALMLQQFHLLEARHAVSWGRNNPRAKTVEFFAGVEKGPGRGAFASMSGALSSQRLQILSADSEVLADELLMLHFVAHDVDYPEGTPEDRLQSLGKALVASVDCLDPPTFRRVWGQELAENAVRLTATPNVVRIENGASPKLTAIEVVTFDRAGLLYSLARKLHDMGLMIQRAKIGGYLDQVVDVFFVTDREGRKVESPTEIDRIRSELHGVIDAPCGSPSAEPAS